MKKNLWSTEIFQFITKIQIKRKTLSVILFSKPDNEGDIKDETLKSSKFNYQDLLVKKMYF